MFLCPLGFRERTQRQHEGPSQSRPWQIKPPAFVALPALAADADVVLGVAGGIVGIAGGIVRAEVRLSGGIDRLIGVAAGKGKRRKRHKDRDPHCAYLEFNDRPSAFATGF